MADAAGKTEPGQRWGTRRATLDGYDLDLLRDFGMCPVCYRQFPGAGLRDLATHWNSQHARVEGVSGKRLSRALATG